MSFPIQRSTIGLLLSLSLVISPTLCWARGGLGGGGARIGGFGGGRMGGGGFGGGRIGGGNFGGGNFRGSVPSQSFRQPSFRQPGFSGSSGMNIPQMRSNFSNPGSQFRGQSLGSSNLRGSGVGSQGLMHHGVNIQPTHRFQSGTGFQLGGQGAGQRFNIQPNHNLYGQGLGRNPQGGVTGSSGLGARMQQGLSAHQGIGSGQHFTGKPLLYGQNAGAARQITQIGSSVGTTHRIGGTTVQQFGNAGLVTTPRGGKFAYFSGPNGAFIAGKGPWGVGGAYAQGGNWQGVYRNTVVNNNYYGWYSGPWGGYWGFGWGYPYYLSAFAWGLGPYYSPWWGYGGYGNYGGYGGYYGFGGGYYGGFGYGAYYNPYCVYAPQTVYVNPLGADYYAQPLTLPLTSTSTTAADPQRDAAFQLVEQGRTLFLQGDYRGALDKYDAAIPNLKDDPIVHELRALALFALGDYHEAAATLNALLAVAPGMDWPSMRNQYPDTATYTRHLRALEGFLRETPNDAAARFVLGYHYLVTNFPDAAAKQFAKVVELEPRDDVAKKLLETLTKDKQPSTPEPLPQGVDANAPLQTDLAGKWLSKGKDGSQFALSLDADGGFTWQVTPPKGNPIQQTGKYTATPDRLILDSSGEQETLMARVESRGPNHFRFWITDDASLVFHREGVNTPEPPATAAQSKDGAAQLPAAPIPLRDVPSAVTPENSP